MRGSAAVQRLTEATPLYEESTTETLHFRKSSRFMVPPTTYVRYENVPKLWQNFCTRSTKNGALERSPSRRDVHPLGDATEGTSPALQRMLTEFNTRKNDVTTTVSYVGVMELILLQAGRQRAIGMCFQSRS